MNWLVSDEELPPTASSWQQVSSTITYFLIRLAPLLGKGTAFIACNRIGSEQVKNAPSATTFTGATCMVELAESVFSFFDGGVSPLSVLPELTSP